MGSGHSYLQNMPLVYQQPMYHSMYTQPVFVNPMLTKSPLYHNFHTQYVRVHQPLIQKLAPLPPLPIPVEDAEQILAGIIDGLVDADDFEYIKVCLKDATTIQTHVEQIVNDIIKGDVTSILDAVTQLGQVLQLLPQDLGDCEAIQPDLVRIEKWAEIFKNPQALAMTVFSNILKNGPKIFQDVAKTQSDVTSKSFHSVGEDIADLTIQVLGPVPAAPAKARKLTYLYSPVELGGFGVHNLY